jgi:GntR family transcriptional regulator/MocR family aminotransferase
MSRQSETKWSNLLDIQVDTGLATPIARQIYQQMRQSIVTSALPKGSRLPSTRELAELIEVSRFSVVAAYDELMAEGFIEGKQGSGTFVTNEIPDSLSGSSMFAVADEGLSRRQLSDAGQRYSEIGREDLQSLNMPFSAGRCSVDLPTLQAWRQISSKHARTISLDALGYTDPFGRESFRQIIAEYLRVFRFVNCTAEQIIVTSGAQQAIDLSIRVLLNPGDSVWVEDPGYPAVQRALAASSVITVPVPVDEVGINVVQGLQKEPEPRAIFVTPSHQHPTGVVMSIERRHELLHAAVQSGAWVIEDDYDSEYRYAGSPLPALQGLDRSGRVIYIGTLSKVLFPGLRTGFAVVPLDLVDAYRGARHLMDRGPPIAFQGVLEEFMRDGFFTSHIRRMRQRYHLTLQSLVKDLRTSLGSLGDVRMPECGMRFVVYLADGIDDCEVAKEAARLGVAIRPISPLYLGIPARSGLDIGFTGYDQRALQVAATRLGEAVRNVHARGRSEHDGQRAAVPRLPPKL